MKVQFYQKAWFKNTVLITIPIIISALGIFVSFLHNTVLKTIFICLILGLLIITVCFVFYYSNLEAGIFDELEKLKKQQNSLEFILTHMENSYKTTTSEISAFSELFEKWADIINSFADNINQNGCISDRLWNKEKIIDTICGCCKNTLQQYCNNFDNSNISIGYISYFKDRDNTEWVHMISHSNPSSIKPKIYNKKIKLTDCNYHFAELIRNRLSDVEIAMNNEEILRLFHKVSMDTDLKKYTQYIAIPLYCKQRKLLGIFQIVTKNGYIVESDKLKLQQMVTDIVIPFSNLIVLTDKISKGLYRNTLETKGGVDNGKV